MLGPVGMMLTGVTSLGEHATEVAGEGGRERHLKRAPHGLVAPEHPALQLLALPPLSFLILVGSQIKGVPLATARLLRRKPARQSSNVERNWKLHV